MVTMERLLIALVVLILFVFVLPRVPGLSRFFT
jgi:hypothetical protein